LAGPAATRLQLGGGFWAQWDFLLGVSDVSRLGALRLREVDPPHRYVDDRDATVPPFARLRELEAIARELSREGVEERPEYAQWLAQLIAPGTSLGGARPKAIQIHGDPAFIVADLEQLYRRIAFSILIANRDDHFRNHGFLRTAGGWRLSPAFDINPNPDKLEHALAIDEADPSPSIANLHATHRYYRLSKARASDVEAEVRAATRRWRRVASKVGVSAAEQRQLAELIDADAE
jgi:serine/threonine protein kinase HipA of HipAB toxin-antitoxin module